MGQKWDQHKRRTIKTIKILQKIMAELNTET